MQDWLFRLDTYHNILLIGKRRLSFLDSAWVIAERELCAFVFPSENTREKAFRQQSLFFRQTSSIHGKDEVL